MPLRIYYERMIYMNYNFTNPIVCKDLNELISKKLQHDVGVLVHQYLNNIEYIIQSSFTAKDLIRYYGLKTKSIMNRCICPLHAGANNPSSFEFNDTKRVFRCHSCEAHGTYLDFIVLMEGYTSKNKYSEAKIFAAKKFAGINLGFTSITEFESQLTSLVTEKYSKTNSLVLNDYFDISIINFSPTESSTIYINKPNINQSEEFIKPNILTNHKEKDFKLEILDIEKVIEEANSSEVSLYGDFKYRIAIDSAINSKLINGFNNDTSLNHKESLYEFMYKKYDITPELSDKYGLISFVKTNQHLLQYPDFFSINDRVLFPLLDHETGITVGYQARTTNLDNKSVPKYINITDFGEVKTKDDKCYRGITHFAVGNFIFNLYNLKSKKNNGLFITEGIADAIKLDSLGYNCISPGQANLTDHQIYLIYKYFSKDIELFLFFDNDKNNVGQNKSIANAYHLYQLGFKNINIIRTYSELGTDVTDVAIKIRNDDTLKCLIDLWVSNAYRFTPADNEILNKIYKTNLFTDSQLMQIDPRNIEDINNKLEYIVELSDKFNIHGSEINTIKLLFDSHPKALELLIKKVNESTIKEDTIDLNNKDTSIIVIENENINNKVLTDYEEISTVQANNNTHSKLTVNWNALSNLTYPQIYTLKKKFDFTTIKKINDLCNKGQISSIIGNIIKNKNFNIDDYLHSKKNGTHPKIKDPSELIDEDDIPF